MSASYADTVISHGFQFINSSVRRPASKTLIDHVFANLPEAKAVTVENDLSDHNSVVVFFDVLCQDTCSRSKRLVRSTRTNYVGVNATLSAAFEAIDYDMHDSNSLTQLILETMSKGIKDFTTSKTCEVKETSSSWISAELVTSYNETCVSMAIFLKEYKMLPSCIKYHRGTKTLTSTMHH